MGNAEYRRELLEPLNFLPNSPTLFNLGVPGGGTLSACFKFDVGDSLLDGEDSIMSVGRKAAAVTKFGGGVGYALSDVRAKNSLVNSTHGKAMGPVALLKYYHSVGEMITQAGKRDAAQMAILSVDHPDIREFIHAKDVDPQGLRTFNISVAVTDAFMDLATTALESDEHALLTELVDSAWSTGDPGLYFIDEAERHNPTPWVGILSGTNPCGEVPLLNNEPCSLGSINLGNYLSGDGSIDYVRLGKHVRLAVRYLDDIVSINTFPVPEIRDANLLTRKIGLGVCGWADLLALMDIDYNTQEAVNLGENVMRFINEEALRESLHLSSERGPAPAFIEQDATYFGGKPRNATRTCIAPTGTIAILMGASSGIEPHFALEWTRTLGTGEIIHERIPVMEHIGNRKPKVSHDIEPGFHIAHQSAFQKHTDLAVSKTVNLHNEATREDIYAAFVEMWESKCKGGTVFRDGCRDEQVLNTLALPIVEQCENCGAGVVHIEGCIECANQCGWAACST